jgi:hypothetical protein
MTLKVIGSVYSWLPRVSLTRNVTAYELASSKASGSARRMGRVQTSCELQTVLVGSITNLPLGSIKSMLNPLTNEA